MRFFYEQSEGIAYGGDCLGWRIEMFCCSGNVPGFLRPIVKDCREVNGSVCPRMYHGICQSARAQDTGRNKLRVSPKAASRDAV
ncbi:MAG TPA: hypothetical protein V6C69_19635 [Trichormus sp.]